MRKRGSREFVLTLAALLVFAMFFSSLQPDAGDFQNYLSGVSPTARVVSFTELEEIGVAPVQTQPKIIRQPRVTQKTIPTELPSYRPDVLAFQEILSQDYRRKRNNNILYRDFVHALEQAGRQTRPSSVATQTSLGSFARALDGNQPQLTRGAQSFAQYLEQYQQ